MKTFSNNTACPTNHLVSRNEKPNPVKVLNWSEAESRLRTLRNNPSSPEFLQLQKILMSNDLGIHEVTAPDQTYKVNTQRLHLIVGSFWDEIIIN